MRRVEDDDAELVGSDPADDLIDGLASVALAVSVADSVHGVASAVARGARLLGGDPAIVLAIAEDAESPLRMVSVEGYDPDDVLPWLEIDRGSGVPLARAIRQRKIVSVDSVDELVDQNPELAPVVEVTGNRRWIAVPLLSGTAAVGAFSLAWRTDRGLSRSERLFLLALSKLGGEALRRVTRDVERRELAILLSEASEEESEELARDLHDHSIQRLAAASIRLGAMRTRHLDALPGDLRGEILRIEEDVQAVIGSLRDMIVGLHRPQHQGLTFSQAVGDVADWLGGSDLSVSVVDLVALEMGEPVADVAYRVAAEAISNVMRHAPRENRRVEVRVVRVGSDEIAVSVSNLSLPPRGPARGRFGSLDDSTGSVGGADGFLPNGVSVDRRRSWAPVIRPTPGHLGLSVLRERVEALGGSLTITAPSGAGGVRLVAVLPHGPDARD